MEFEIGEKINKNRISSINGLQMDSNEANTLSQPMVSRMNLVNMINGYIGWTWWSTIISYSSWTTEIKYNDAKDRFNA